MPKRTHLANWNGIHEAVKQLPIKAMDMHAMASTVREFYSLTINSSAIKIAFKLDFFDRIICKLYFFHSFFV
jgi:hypothetical protein